MKTIQKISFLLMVAVVIGATLLFLSPEANADHSGFRWRGTSDRGLPMVFHPRYGEFDRGGSRASDAPYQTSDRCHFLSGIEESDEGEDGITARYTRNCGDNPIEESDNHRVTIGNSDSVETDETGAVVDSGEENFENEGPQCEAEGLIGFFSCDIMMWILEKIKDVQEWIVELLFETDPLVVEGTDNPVYKIWSNMRNVANALLVVAFMAIIFSLALSVNVDAYTIKRLMPKLLVAVVAVQASYLVSGLMVDVTNILGQGLQGLTDITLNNLDVDSAWQTEGRLGSTAASGAFVALIGAGTLVAIPVLAPIFLLMFLVILGAFIIVALRDVFIILFIVLSPLFFLANLLPATEKWFKFWWSNFARLLLMYPFIILMIQIANLAAIITLADAGTPANFDPGASSEVAARTQNFIKPFMAIIMQFLGILSIYFAFRVGGSALSIATQGVSRMRRMGGGGKGKDGSGGGKGLTGKIKSGMKQRQNEYANAARGNKLTQAIASPKGTYARSSRLPGGKETAAQNLSTFNANVGEKAKQLESGEYDPKTLKEFGEVGGDQRALSDRIRELRGTGDKKDEDQANKLSAMSHLGGSRSMQAAAAKQAASQGAVDDDTFAKLKESFGDDSILSQQVVGNVARSAKDAGRPDLFAKHNNEGKSVDDVMQGMQAKGFVDMKSDAIWDKDAKQPTEFGKKLREQAEQPDSSIRRTLGSSLSPASGMSAENREAIKRSLMDDDDHQKWQQAKQEAERKGQPEPLPQSKLHSELLKEQGNLPNGYGGQGGGQPGGGGGTQGGGQQGGGPQFGGQHYSVDPNDPGTTST